MIGISIPRDGVHRLRPGDNFCLITPDGHPLTVIQTADWFTISRKDGTIAYTRPTSSEGKRDDMLTNGWDTPTTGRN